MPAERRDLLSSIHPIAKALRRIEDDAAESHGLTMWQYAVLAVVCARPALNQNEVAGLLDYSRNRIVADLDHLESMGCLVRTPGADRRANALTATDAGADVMRAVQREIHSGEDELLAGLSPTARAAFGRAADQLADHLGGQD
ncbi:MarR family winged helix-turn-helix transcriptional regulator [Luteipulveratus mongoliensis]|uniref:HTH marR-type domain-containing protein n=1 Tax=Luteipulveratus mongoliensis TaxID=571913 RepID=A0A0K1JGI4_9MICO|nr:MarR family transcriptional regulator [Luteipulveratus mongoliensis]AKU15816.1 hypothetical protein VV02_08040 [Luteipulveratus mongoliensis]